MKKLVKNAMIIIIALILLSKIRIIFRLTSSLLFTLMVLGTIYYNFRKD